ncbi:MAG: hypothetical protein IPP88_00005, partial [Betaproteobacteria bacterium]|nr:hypothetical protein [Betaproteobacteria bacterium]
MTLTTPKDCISNFPLPLEKEVNRDNCIDSVQAMFRVGNSVVIVEGEQSGSGATVFLGQYVEKNPKSCLAVFLVATSPHGYSPDSVRYQLYEQGIFLLDAVLPKQTTVSEQQFNQLLVRLRRLAKSAGPLTFVIDGIDQ